MRTFVVVLSIITALIVLVYASLLIYVGHMSQQDTKVKSDVIVVLGERAYASCFGPRCAHGFAASGQYNTCLVARVDQAVSLYKEHFAPKLLMSGGTDKEDNKNEAEAMRTIALEAGVPSVDILMEKESTSTYENLAFSQKIMNEAGLHSAIIVTDPYVNARAGLVAAKLHYSYSLSPATASPCWDSKNYFSNPNVLEEPLALIEYRLTNKI